MDWYFFWQFSGVACNRRELFARNYVQEKRIKYKMITISWQKSASPLKFCVQYFIIHVIFSINRLISQLYDYWSRTFFCMPITYLDYNVSRLREFGQLLYKPCLVGSWYKTCTKIKLLQSVLAVSTCISLYNMWYIRVLGEGGREEFMILRELFINYLLLWKRSFKNSYSV